MELLLVLIAIAVVWFVFARRRRTRRGIGGFAGLTVIAVLFVAGWIGYRAIVGPEPQRTDYAAGDMALRALLQAPPDTP